MIRDLKREVSEYKRKYQESLTEATNLRKERDEIRAQKHDEGLSIKKSAEEERSRLNELQSEIDRLKFKLKCSEEDLQKEVTSFEEKNREIQTFKVDKSSLESMIKEKERLIMTLNRQLNDAKDDLKNKEREFRVTLQKLTDDEKQRSKNDKLEIEASKDKIQELEQKLYKLDLKSKKEIEGLEQDNEKYEREIKVLVDESKHQKQKINDLQREIDMLHRSNTDGKY